MSRNSKKMTEILESVFEGYSLDDNGKLVVANEAASKKARESLHEMVLETARDLWDQLEAAEDSLSSVAEEIRFEELNTDPSSTTSDVAHAAIGAEDAAAVDAPPAGAEAAPALESAKSIQELLGSDDLNLDDIFENMDHLDSHENVSAPAGPDMPFDEMMGDAHMMDSEDEGEVQDGDQDYDDLMIGMGDEGEMGDEGAAFDNGGSDEMDYENGAADDMGDPEANGDEFGGDMGDEPPMDDNGFDFDLDLEDPMGDDEEMDEMGGHSMRMESKGDDDDDKDDDKKDDDDKDDDDDDKPAFLKKDD